MPEAIGREAAAVGEGPGGWLARKEGLSLQKQMGYPGLDTGVAQGLAALQGAQAALANQIALNAGVLSISSDANLGNPNAVVAAGLVIQPAVLYLNGGQLLVTENITTIRSLQPWTNSSIVVSPGKTYTVNAAMQANAGVLTIAGGTVLFSASNPNGAVAVANGATVGSNATGGTPFGKPEKCEDR
jgi:hypothetical protein